MLCGYPTDLGRITVPCGRCMACRINKRREWTGRIMLEATYSENPSSFLTLTYDEINLPPGEEVDPIEIQTFIKGVRNAKRQTKIRFFGVGEYGDKFGRPHYHLAMFNLAPEENEKLFKKTWQNGFVHTGEITPQSAAYIASYTIKKLTKPGEDALEGKHPEFARMSKYPPIGAPGIRHVNAILNTRCGQASIADRGDVPTQIQIGSKKYPIGKYWRNYLRRVQEIPRPYPNNGWVITDEEQAQAARQVDKLFNTRNKTWSNRKTF